MEEFSTANASLREELEALKIERVKVEVKFFLVLQYDILRTLQIEEGEIVEDGIYRTRFEDEKKEWLVRLRCDA